MKVKPEHLNALERLLNEAMARHGTSALTEHAAMLRALPIVQDVHMRFRWDLWHSVPAVDRIPLMDELYAYCDDRHIDTALRYLVETP